MRTWLILPFFALVTVGAEAHAGCCQVVKVDDETPSTVVRVCAPDGAGGCGDVLFAGPLALGESQSVCTEGDRIVYAEGEDPGDALGDPTSAVCDGNEVKI